MIVQDAASTMVVKVSRMSVCDCSSRRKNSFYDGELRLFLPTESTCSGLDKRAQIGLRVHTGLEELI